MAFGKLYTYPGNPRSTAIRAVAKANNIELEVVETEPAKGVPEEYLKINKLGKVPTFVGEDGFTLHEAIAIAIYSTYSTYYFCYPSFVHLHTSSFFPPCVMMKNTVNSYPCLNHSCGFFIN